MNNDVLIDGGNVADGSLVVNYLKDQGVDDIGGIPDVLDAFMVEKIVDSGFLTDSNISGEFSDKAISERAVYQADNKH